MKPVTLCILVIKVHCSGDGRNCVCDSGTQNADMPCASVMCAEPCPPGQYLAVNEYGCEICDCYDPCEVIDQRG